MGEEAKKGAAKQMGGLLVIGGIKGATMLGGNTTMEFARIDGSMTKLLLIARDWYYQFFSFWVRVDMTTKSEENKTLKAVIVVSVLQTWFLFGFYCWTVVLLGVPRLPRQAPLALAAVVYVGNLIVLRRGGWKDYEARFETFSRRRQRLAYVGVMATVVGILIFGAAAALALRSRS